MKTLFYFIINEKLNINKNNENTIDVREINTDEEKLIIKTEKR